MGLEDCWLSWNIIVYSSAKACICKLFDILAKTNLREQLIIHSSTEEDLAKKASSSSWIKWWFSYHGLQYVGQESREYFHADTYAELRASRLAWGFTELLTHGRHPWNKQQWFPDAAPQAADGTSPLLVSPSQNQGNMIHHAYVIIITNSLILSTFSRSVSHSPSHFIGSSQQAGA